MLYIFIFSYFVVSFGKTELDRKAIQCMMPGKDADGRVVIFQFLLTICLFS